MLLCCSLCGTAQLSWQNVNDAFGKIPKGIRVFMTNDSLNEKPFKAYYVSADLKNKDLLFDTDTTLGRRLTPEGFYLENNQPLVLVNTTFFSFATHQNLNLVVKDGQLASYNVHHIAGRGKDTFTFRHPFTAAIGISKKRKADVAWVYTDTALSIPYASQKAVPAYRDSFATVNSFFTRGKPGSRGKKDQFHSSLFPGVSFSAWKQQCAVGGGPALVQDGKIAITNNEEIKFGGKAINDLHPRTLMGYTADDRLIIMVIEGRNPGIASGASLLQAAKLMQSLGCIEALNLDGGGSSCMLINGKETIWPSDKGKQRAVPAVFIIKQKIK